MPFTHTEPDALSRLYAASLFELAEAEGGQARIEEILGELDELLELARADQMIGEFLSSRILSVDARSASLDKIFKGRLNALTLKFLQVLNHKNRLGHLPAIVAAYDQMVQNAFGRVEVDLYTASPITPDELSLVKSQLKTVLGKEPVIHSYTEPAMLGGLKIQIGDRLIDGSVAMRLRKLRDRLEADGAEQVRARADDLID